MKKLFIFTIISMLGLSVACNRSEQGTGSGDNLDIQREEEINRDDMSEESYDQSDMGSGTAAPSNVDSDLDSGSSDMGSGAAPEVESDMESGMETEQQ